MFVEGVNEYGRGEESSRIVFITASRRVQDLQVVRSARDGRGAYFAEYYDPVGEGG